MPKVDAGRVGVSEARAPTSDPRLLGTWRIVSFENVDPSGQVSRPYGELPRGHLVYDPAGHVGFQIIRARRQRPPARAVQKPEVPAGDSGLVSYFGTYLAEPDRQIVTHFVEGSSLPDLIGASHARHYKIFGDNLVIEMETPVGHRFYREFQRVLPVARR